jgi:arylsulfatase A-like enzyme
VTFAHLAGLAALASSCGEREPAASGASMGRARTGAAAGWNILLITLDTTRRDRIGCYGYAQAHTPNIDALASRGLRFEDAVTSVPVTLPSHATMLTGLYPPRHGVRDNGRQTLAPAHETLTEALSARGYETAAFVGAFVLDQRFGLDQGFDVYDFSVSASGYRPRMPDFNERPANDVTDAALRWLGGRGSGARPEAPFFAWVHYFDPHLPYESPLGREARFTGRGYDAEIAFADAQIGRLVGELDRQGVRDRTLVIVTADHGEALGEHGEATHGLFVYEGTLRVPLIISNPALFDRAHVVSDRIAGLVDLRATIEDLLGASTGAPSDGRSLLDPAAAAGRAIYIETLSSHYLAGWSPLHGLRTRSAKYILAPEPEYYDLSADRGEARNLWAAGAEPAESMRSELAETMAAWAVADAGAGEAAGEGTGSERALTDEEIERLEALGYMQGAQGAPSASGSPSADRPAAFDPTLPDPKRMVGIFNKAEEAEHLYEQGKFAESERIAREVIDACPSCVSALRVLAFSLLRQNRAGDAVELLQRSAQRIPDTFLFRSLAQVLIIDGRCDEAESALAAYEALDPGDGRVALLRGDCLANRGQWAAAVEQYEIAARIDPNRTGVSARERIEQARAASATPPR